MLTPARAIALAALCAVSLCSFARADVPRTIAFQGSLKTAAGTPITGPQQVTFTLYDAATGGTALWTETQTVTATNGLFAAPLGSITPLNLPFDKPYWVGIKVGDDAEMTPRVPLTSAPYALAVPDKSVGTAKINVDGPLDLNGNGVSNFLSLQAADGNVDLLYHQDNNLFIKTGSIKGAVAIGHDGNVDLDVSGMIHAGRLAVEGGVSMNPGQTVGPGLADTFPYGNQSMGQYALGWFHDPFHGGDQTAWLSGWGGITLFTAGVPQLSIDRGGTVSLAATLNVAGNARAQSITLTSSRRYKRGVQPLTNALGTLSQLQGVSYVWDQQHGGKPDIGFIAEDAGKVVPELVTWEPNGVDAVGMDYSHLTALTVEGIKEQQAEIAGQTQRITALEAENTAKDTKIADLEARLARLERLVEGKR